MAIINMLPHPSGGVTDTLPTELINNGKIFIPGYLVKNGTIDDSGTFNFQTNGNVAAVATIGVPIDVTDYSTLHIEGRCRSFYGNGKAPLIGLNNSAFINTTGSTSGNSNVGTAVMLLSTSTPGTQTEPTEISKTINVSSMTGIYYVCMAVSGTGNWNGLIEIDNLYLS